MATVAVEANDVFTLLWWWAIWTIFDTYLIIFTPISEVAVLSVCFLWWSWPRFTYWLAKGQHSVETGLRKVTQTDAA